MKEGYETHKHPSLGKKRTAECCNNFSEIGKGKWADPEYREMMLNARKAMYSNPERLAKLKKIHDSPEFKEKCRKNVENSSKNNPLFIAKWGKCHEGGYKINEIGRQHIAEANRLKCKDPEFMRKRNAMRGTPEFQRKLSDSMKKCWQKPGYASKRLQTIKLNNSYNAEVRKILSAATKECWNNKEYRAKNLKATALRPTSFEQKIIELSSKYNLGFLYTGDGKVFINHKNPDFIHNELKIVIEVFSDFYKIRRYKTIDNYKNFCLGKYSSDGWNVIFIDTKDIKCMDWENKCLGKIKEAIDNVQNNSVQRCLVDG